MTNMLMTLFSSSEVEGDVGFPSIEVTTLFVVPRRNLSYFHLVPRQTRTQQVAAFVGTSCGALAKAI